MEDDGRQQNVEKHFWVKGHLKTVSFHIVKFHVKLKYLTQILQLSVCACKLETQHHFYIFIEKDHV